MRGALGAAGAFDGLVEVAAAGFVLAHVVPAAAAAAADQRMTIGRRLTKLAVDRDIEGEDHAEHGEGAIVPRARAVALEDLDQGNGVRAVLMGRRQALGDLLDGEACRLTAQLQVAAGADLRG
ncbi:hypothetical protein [Sphingomonas sp. PB4P5]|uniref:hypothetical protein n=1 Tax=Parasphingomonas puruogangriensis TaxID=3096155 RepID=UPI002FC6A4DA